MIMGSKIHAVLAGRVNVSFDDVRRVALPALRHRLILNYEAEAKGVTADRVVAELLAAVPEEG
jgi:MoxR-like ATPase